MYGLSQDFRVEGLVDSVLSQICVGKFDVQFRFDSGTFFCVQGTARMYQKDQIIANWTEDYVWDDLSFQNILNCKVLKYSVENDRVLAIFFENDFRLELVDDSQQYESMQIYPKGELSEMIVI